jgi:uncharacterized protein YkwD
MDYTLKLKNTAQKTLLRVKLLFIPCQENDFTPRLLQSKMLFYVVVGLVILKIATVVFFIPFSENSFFADISKNDLVYLLNQSREQAGLNPLSENAKLDQAAYLKALDMVQKGYFAHQSPQGVTPWFWFSQAGYRYSYAGENLAIGFINSKDLFNAWLNSPEHKANVLNPNYKDIGTAFLQGFGNNGAIVVVQLFGAPATTMPQSEKNKKVLAITQEIPATQTPVPAEPIITPMPQVLSQQTQPVVNAVLPPDNPSKGYNTFLSVIIKSNTFLQYFTYGFLAALILCLALNVFIYFRIQRRTLIIRSLLAIAIVYATTFINQDIIYQFIRHTIII